VDELVAFGVIVGFIGVMLLLPFGIMIGMALPRGKRSTAVSENRQSTSSGGGRVEA
jgi:hypothetical protein